jgi:hypothetical protein
MRTGLSGGITQPSDEDFRGFTPKIKNASRVAIALRCAYLEFTNFTNLVDFKRITGLRITNDKP